MPEFLKIYEDKPNEATIKKVVDVLKSGGLVIIFLTFLQMYHFAISIGNSFHNRFAHGWMWVN